MAATTLGRVFVLFGGYLGVFGYVVPGTVLHRLTDRHHREAQYCVPRVRIWVGLRAYMLYTVYCVYTAYTVIYIV